MFVGTPKFWTDPQYNQEDNGFEKGPVPQLGWGRGINRTTVLKKAPSPSWAGGGVKLSTGQRFWKSSTQAVELYNRFTVCLFPPRGCASIPVSLPNFITTVTCQKKSGNGNGISSTESTGFRRFVWIGIDKKSKSFSFFCCSLYSGQLGFFIKK